DHRAALRRRPAGRHRTTLTGVEAAAPAANTGAPPPRRRIRAFRGRGTGRRDQASVRGRPPAASRTAPATKLLTSGWKTLGTMSLAPSAAGVRTAARALAAAASMSMVATPAGASRSPRKTPGNASTLLIWLG